MYNIVGVSVSRQCTAVLWEGIHLLCYFIQGKPGMAAYSCSKAAVIGLVKSVGKEYAESGITVNALAPTVVRTTMIENMIPAQVKALTDKIPKKRCVCVCFS